MNIYVENGFSICYYFIVKEILNEIFKVFRKF